MKYLLLIDFNGTLCYRHEEPIRGVKEDLYLRRKYFYKRPGCDAFVQQLAAHGAFEVAVYSSMMRHNLLDGLDAILPGCQRMYRALDREMNKPDPEGENEWDTVRDMAKVWRALPAYDARSTILVDNEARKFSDAPRNGIVLSEFGPADVRSRRQHTLAALQRYLEALAAAAPADVRTYLAAHPFCDGAAPAPVPQQRAAAPAGLEQTLSALSIRRSGAGAGVSVPAGTTLLFRSVEDSVLKLHNWEHDVCVSCDVTKPLPRIEAKMDFHRLVRDATECGAVLDISVRGRTVQLAAV